VSGPHVLLYVALALCSYLLGAIPVGYLVGRVVRGIDIRSYGSGVIGATNTLRTLGKGPSAFVFLFDVLKGFGPVFAIRILLHEPGLEAACGLAVIIGHNWPVYIGFRGGRGISSGFGALTGLTPVVGGITMLGAILTIALSRYVSLGSILGACVAFPLMLIGVFFFHYPPEYMLYATVGPIIVIWKHRANIQRLLSGTERKIGQKVEVARPG
jgi:acyl phosphate:glycerol-3-phosphate acyltransferase